MEARLKVSMESGEEMSLELSGSSRAVEELLVKLRGAGGKFSVAGGMCCWTLSREGSTLHLLLDSEKVA